MTGKSPALSLSKGGKRSRWAFFNSLLEKFVADGGKEGKVGEKQSHSGPG